MECVHAKSIRFQFAQSEQLADLSGKTSANRWHNRTGNLMNYVRPRSLRTEENVGEKCSGTNCRGAHEELLLRCLRLICPDRRYQRAVKIVLLRQFPSIEFSLIAGLRSGELLASRDPSGRRIAAFRLSEIFLIFAHETLRVDSRP